MLGLFFPVQPGACLGDFSSDSWEIHVSVKCARSSYLQQKNIDSKSGDPDNTASLSAIVKPTSVEPGVVLPGKASIAVDT